MARQRMPRRRKARVPFGEVLLERWREARWVKSVMARDVNTRVRRKARTATTTCRANTPRTADRAEDKDIGWTASDGRAERMMGMRMAESRERKT